MVIHIPYTADRKCYTVKISKVKSHWKHVLWISSLLRICKCNYSFLGYYYIHFPINQYILQISSVICSFLSSGFTEFNLIQFYFILFHFLARNLLIFKKNEILILIKLQWWFKSICPFRSGPILIDFCTPQAIFGVHPGLVQKKKEKKRKYKAQTLW